MRGEIYKRKIKVIEGNGTGSVSIRATRNMRVHGFLLGITYAGGTNTVAALATALTQVKAKRGNEADWDLTGTELRDFLLLHGQDFSGLPNTKTTVQIPFAPQWLFDNVANALAWNPADGRGDISLELTASTNITVVAYELVSDDLDVPSAGRLTLETISPVVGSTQSTISQPAIEIRGALMQVSIYPDSDNTNEITPAGLTVGSADVYAHELLSSTENDEILESYGKTPAASGRTANVYDMLFVHKSNLAQAIDLEAWKSCKLDIRAAAAMAGTSKVMLARIEN